MAPGADPAFQQALDKLLLQVNADNVLAVHRAFQQHADDLWVYLTDLEQRTTLRKCGEDPVSKEILRDESLGGKVRELVRVHWEHQHELQVVADHLVETARQYGRSEEEISRNVAGVDR